MLIYSLFKRMREGGERRRRGKGNFRGVGKMGGGGGVRAQADPGWG